MKSTSQNCVQGNPSNTVISLFEGQVLRKPNQVAIISGNGVINFIDFNNQVNQFARYLQEYSRPQDIIGVELQRSTQLLIAIFAILKCNCTYIPIDPDWPLSRKQNVIENSGLRCVIVAEKINKYCHENFIQLSINNDVTAYSKDNLSIIPQPDDLAYVIYTSGTTGQPKGVQIQHKALMNRLHWMQSTFPIEAGDVVFQKTYFCFDVSIWELLWWAMVGASVVLLPPCKEYDVRLFAKMIYQNHITVIHFVPSVFKLFLDYIGQDYVISQLSSLKYVFCSGESLQINSVAHFNQLFPSSFPKLINLYGPTEAAIDATYHVCLKSPYIQPVPIGKAINQMTTYIFDEALEPVSKGQIGELYLSGIGLSLGYLNQPDLTAKYFLEVGEPFPKRMYRTGDRAYLNENNELVYIGRNDDQVKLRGQRIELPEIEYHISLHSNVKQCSVVAIMNNQYDSYLHAFVIRHEPSLNQNNLLDFLEPQVPSYMMPGKVTFLQSLPLTKSGKINKTALQVLSQSEEISLVKSDFIHEIFEQRVQQYPTYLAVITEKTFLTYAELNYKSNQLAHYLNKRFTQCYGTSIQSNPFIGICLQRGVDLIIAILAVLKTGAAYVPLDPDYPVHRLAYVFTDSQYTLLITNQTNYSLYCSLTREFVINPELEKLEIANQPRYNLDHTMTTHDLAYLIYTSGSTGEPKGVQVMHSSVCNMIMWTIERYPVENHDRLLQMASIAFDLSVWEIFTALLSGAGLVLTSPNLHKDANYLLATIIKYQVTVLAAVPSLLDMMLLHRNFDQCSSLRKLLCCGEALSNSLCTKLLDRYYYDLFNGYGPTETTIMSTHWKVERRPAFKKVLLGNSISNTYLQILNEEQQPVYTGKSGELYIAGIGVSRGYLHKSELTREKFLQLNLDGTPRLYYRTGDWVRQIKTGELEYLGRMDHQIKLRGFRIELGEIETWIMGAPNIKKCIVTVKNIKNIDYLVAYYLTEGIIEKNLKDTLTTYLQKVLPAHAIPTYYVLLQSFPLLPNGKTDRTALPEPKHEHRACILEVTS